MLIYYIVSVFGFMLELEAFIPITSSSNIIVAMSLSGMAWRGGDWKINFCLYAMVREWCDEISDLECHWSVLSLKIKCQIRH